MLMENKFDIAIVGAGIVGLATARQFTISNPDLKVIVLEKGPLIASQQTGHNSGVIHSGVYYKPGSLKAELCVAGSKLMYEYCDDNKIPYKIVGKLIVATKESEVPRLNELCQRGLRNSVPDIKLITKDKLKELEPHCNGIAALRIPGTGIVDFSKVAGSFKTDAEGSGTKFKFNFKVEKVHEQEDTTYISSRNDTIKTRFLITCAGIYSDRLALTTGGSPYPKIIPFRGDYLVLKDRKRFLVNGNIYPVPSPDLPFLGAHFTPRMDGSLLLGPNAVLAFSREGYCFSDVCAKDLLDICTSKGFLKMSFNNIKVGIDEMLRDIIRPLYVKSLQRYIPEITASDCVKGPSGIRAQAVSHDGTLIDDFVFDQTGKRVIHVRNAPSPAATSSLAIGRMIVDKAMKAFNIGES